MYFVVGVKHHLSASTQKTHSIEKVALIIPGDGGGGGEGERDRGSDGRN